MTFLKLSFQFHNLTNSSFLDECVRKARKSLKIYICSFFYLHYMELLFGWKLRRKTHCSRYILIIKQKHCLPIVGLLENYLQKNCIFVGAYQVPNKHFFYPNEYYNFYNWLQIVINELKRLESIGFAF